MKLNTYFGAAITALLLSGCSQQRPTTTSVQLGPHEEAQAENNLFLQQKSFDPWILSTSDPAHKVPAYIGVGYSGSLFDSSGKNTAMYVSGEYDHGTIKSLAGNGDGIPVTGSNYYQSLDLRTGKLTTSCGNTNHVTSFSSSTFQKWPDFWKSSDIAIAGDPEAQQVTHAELFYLCSSLTARGANSIPPMGLSSSVYDGHIFWDAEIWMMPALLPQHPNLAKSIVDYRFKRLAAAKALAKKHGYRGAEYPWESAETGLEEAPQEFSNERHITADVAYAAWQYYLWTGDKSYLETEAWPILQANAEYWESKARLGSDGKYHLANVIGPDETAGQVTDDAWTNALVKTTIEDAIDAAEATGNTADPKWKTVAEKLLQPFDSAANLVLQYPLMNRSNLQAKQADATMLVYPLDVPLSEQAKSNTLDYYLKHTIAFGPAMTSSINATVAAKLGRAQQSLDLFHGSYRPFMRGPWDAFSEKRTKSDVYFMTGMGGCLQTVLYGFGGINIVSSGHPGVGTLIARTGDAALYTDPHLPPGWTSLTIYGIKFRGEDYTVSVTEGNKVVVTNTSDF